MSFSLTSFWSDVRGRLLADSTLTAIINGQVAISQSVRGANLPYVVINVVDINPYDAFKTHTDVYRFDVHYMAERLGVGTDGGAPATVAATAMQRIAGDWEDQATRIPTFGLDHYTLPLTATGYTATPIQRNRGWIQIPEDDVLHYVLTLETYISKAV